MHRQKLLTQLKQYVPEAPLQQETLDQIVSFVQNHSNCFQRTLEHGHITGSAWLLNKKKDKVLLTLHRKLRKWIQLGGHADGDSDILNVAFSEAKEESGLQDIIILNTQIFDIAIHSVPKTVTDLPHIHYDIRFLFQTKNDEHFCIKSEESIDLKWFTYDELSFLTLEPSVRRMAEKWRKYAC